MNAEDTHVVSSEYRSRVTMTSAGVPRTLGGSIASLYTIALAVVC